VPGVTSALPRFHYDSHRWANPPSEMEPYPGPDQREASGLLAIVRSTSFSFISENNCVNESLSFTEDLRTSCNERVMRNFRLFFLSGACSSLFMWLSLGSYGAQFQTTTPGSITQSTPIALLAPSIYQEPQRSIK
jgi:hypothetical protein